MSGGGQAGAPGAGHSPAQGTGYGPGLGSGYGPGLGSGYGTGQAMGYGAGYGPGQGPGRGLALHEELYLIAHDQSGKPAVHQTSMALGLAGAALLELALSGRVALADGRAAAVPAAPPRPGPGDGGVADGLLALIQRDGARRDARLWIKKTAEDVYPRTRDGLVSAGVLARVTGRRLGMLPRTRYQVTDLAHVVRASYGVRSAVEGWKEPDARAAALCGLVAALRVEGELYLDQPSAQLVGRLRAIAEASSPAVRDVVTAVDAFIGEAAVAVYR
ncbi:GOLPH3/VPS74 family protein [Nonomuraea pusilla]|uniref:Golgi phosphoprotein 3 (GPP34) n=1 Tax=Nonomuraea pusilla TaxID=46177 RepID=A0A1H7U589_9ACTN|nr:GPP34 family phosphoprotein [Nonomuraea pusilla]SEL91848.1 Golgi phosphoprotein 3 (GPP34) [Nonomuraea pusilla]